MKRAVALLALVGLLSLIHVPEVFGGGGQAGDLTPGAKISGPAVSATIVIDVTACLSGVFDLSGRCTDLGTKGQTTIRAQKGTSFAGALFTHQTALRPQPGHSEGWFQGCDGIRGANHGTWTGTMEQLTSVRFDQFKLTTWIPALAVTELFGPDGLNLPIGPGMIPVITDTDNSACTPMGDGRFILSFTAVIQFADR